MNPKSRIALLTGAMLGLSLAFDAHAADTSLAKASDDAAAAIAAAGPGHTIAAGPYKATWQSLADNYQCPDWFRDAKFGIWAHWSAQCVPEEGDWYARRMYL